ncbi:MAG: exodeoxyribonuclease VII small subunit [Ruminococcaceae bacterium]|nr:exodeoxyribonuclease VII small subunit [Oscillospiraceae bacterium]
MAKKTITFEAAMARLEEILHALEGGTETLDDSLKLYEEGISLIRSCSELLENAEQSVKLLSLQADGRVGLKDFNKTEAVE